jgi:hypothetical protein
VDILVGEDKAPSGQAASAENSPQRHKEHKEDTFLGVLCAFVVNSGDVP